MRNNDILIRQIIFDLDIPSQADFQTYTDAISQIVKGRLHSMLEKIASKLKGDSDIFIENVSIDIGEIDLDNWDASEAILYDQLLNLLKGQETSSNSYQKRVNKSRSLFQLLYFIAEFGLLPWSHNTKQKVNSFFKKQLDKVENRNTLFDILIRNKIAYSRIFNILDQKNSLVFLKFLLKKDYVQYKRLQDFNKSLHNLRGSFTTLGSIKKDEYRILRYFYENPNKTERSIQQSIDYLKKTYSLTAKEVSKFHLIEKKGVASFAVGKEQSYLSGTSFRESHFKQLIQLLLKLEDKKSIKKTLGSMDFNTPSVKTKFFVKGDFFKTLEKILQLYKKNQNIKEKKLVQSLLDFLMQNKASNKFEQYVVLTLGDAIFSKKKYASLRNATLFKNILSAIRIPSLAPFVEVVNILDLILSLEVRAVPKDEIRANAIQALYPSLEKTKPKDLFIAVLKNLEAARKLPPPFQMETLEEQQISKIFKQVRRMQTSASPPTSLDANYFDFILNIDNEITNRKESKQRGTDFISIKDILKNTKTLLAFLKAYRLREEVLYSFSVLTLQATTEKVFSELLKTGFQSWLLTEQALIKIQDQIRFSDLDLKQFKAVLRYFLIKSLTSGDAAQESYPGEFTFNFLRFIASRSNIYYNKIKEILMEGTIGSEIEEVGFGFSVYIDNTASDLLPQKAKTDLFYKNIYYYYLKTKRIPKWSSLELIDDFEIVNFIKVLIDKKDSPFLETLFREEQIVENILPYLKGLSTDYYKNLLKILQKEKKQGYLRKIFNTLTKDQSKLFSPFVLFELIVSNQLWRIKNPLYLKTRIIKVSKPLDPKLQSLLNSKITSIIKPKDTDVMRAKVWSQKEYQFLMSYFIDSGELIVSPFFSKKEITKKVISYLAKNPERSIGYLLELNRTSIKQTAAYKEVFTKELILLLIEAYFSEATLFLREIQIYFKELEALGADEVLFYKSVDLILSNYLVENKRKQFVIPQLVNLVAEFKGEKYTLIVQRLRSLFEESQSKPIKQSLLLEKISKYESKLEAFRAYVAFGYYPAEMSEISQRDLFKELVKEYPLLIKKRLYFWSPDDEKLKRLFKIVSTEQQRRLLLSLVHPKLSKLLDALPEMINSLLKETDITYAKKPTSANQLKIILSLWARMNFKVNPYELIVAFIKDFFAENRISDTYFRLQINALKEDFKSDNMWTELKPFLEQTTKRKKPNKVEILEESKTNKIEFEEGISIQNSGLVIAWPFLNILFSKLGLIEDGKLKSDAATQKAIAATQYLVDGKNEIEETELLLNKILCGADPDFYVDQTLELNEIELGICDMALKTIVAQWGKVKSIATLREYFFKRNGVLKFDKNLGAELHVKKETRDILIKFLSWNLSVIKTSIMSTKLIIHWKYD